MAGGSSLERDEFIVLSCTREVEGHRLAGAIRARAQRDLNGKSDWR
jgi:hypothetical protein